MTSQTAYVAFVHRPIDKSAIIKYPNSQDKFKKGVENIQDRARMGFSVFEHNHVVEDGKIQRYSFINIVTKAPVDFSGVPIKPNFIIDGVNNVFEFSEYIDENMYVNYSDVLEWMFEGKAEICYPKVGTTNQITQDIVKSIPSPGTERRMMEMSLIFYSRFKSQNIFGYGIEKTNVDEIISKSRIVQVQAVAEKLGYMVSNNLIDGDEKYFVLKKKNVIVDLTGLNYPCGNPFFFVLQKLDGAIENTMRWFVENYKWKLQSGGEAEVFKGNSNIIDGVAIDSGEGFIQTQSGYVTVGDKPKQISDFIIRVYYTITNEDQTKDTIVQLVNYKENISTGKIVYKNTYSKTKFMEFCAQYGNFHFYGKDNDIARLHAAITAAKVPEIKQVTGLGFHGSQLILGNGIFNLNTKKLTIGERNELNYIFNDEGEGYSIKASNKMHLFDSIDASAVHKFTEHPKIIDSTKFYETLGGMYNGNIGKYLALYLMGLVGYGVFKDFNMDYKMPFLITHGMRGCGKTEFLSNIATVFGIGKNGIYNFNNITNFVFLNSLCTFRGIPVLFNEYRNEGVNEDKSKLGKIRSAYDRHAEARGRADQTQVTYNYTATIAMDGEEAPVDGAARSRSIMLYMNKSNKLSEAQGGMIEFKKRLASDEIKHFLYSYLRKIPYDYGTFRDFYMEGLRTFKSPEERIVQNIAIIYAGAMLYIPSLKEDIIKMLDELILVQNKDQEEFNGISEFITIMAKCVPVMFDGHFIHDGHLYIDLYKLEEYIRSRRIAKNFSFDTYENYLDDKGWSVGMHEVFDRKEGKALGMRYCVKIPIDESFPRKLLTIQECFEYATLKGFVKNLK